MILTSRNNRCSGTHGSVGESKRGAGVLCLNPNGKTLDDDMELAWLGSRQSDFNSTVEVKIRTLLAQKPIHLTHPLTLNIACETEDAGASVRGDYVLRYGPTGNETELYELARFDLRLFGGTVTGTGYTGTLFACFAEGDEGSVEFSLIR